MSRPRDISVAHAAARLTALGFTRCGFLGYWLLPAPLDHCSVSWLNAGENNRARVAYMLERWEAEQAKGGAR